MQSHSQQTDLDSSQLPPATTHTQLYSSGIVQDSQESAGEATFLPATQYTTDSNHQSTATTTESPEDEDEDEVIEDLSPLYIIQTALSRDSSPIRSIIETIPDTIADSQSQPQQGAQGIADTLLAMQSLIETSGSTETAINSLSEVVGQVDSQDGDLHIEVQPLSTNLQSDAEDITQFPFHSQYPLHTFQEALPHLPVPASLTPPHIYVATSISAKVPPRQELTSSTAELQTPPALQLHLHQPEDSAPSTVSRVPGPQEQVAEKSVQDSQIVADSLPHCDFLGGSQLLTSSEQSSGSREQYAQIVPREAELSTQEDTTRSIRKIVDGEDKKRRGSSESRHDSSQDSPERTRSLGCSFSPIPDPPSFSLRTVTSKPPSRPSTPEPTSSWSIIMSGKSTGAEVARELNAGLEKALAQNPFTPNRSRMGRVSAVNSVNNSEAPPVVPGSAPRSLGANVSPLLTHEGTRSPSAIPDHAPELPEPTSLRAVVAAFELSETPKEPEVPPKSVESVHELNDNDELNDDDELSNADDEESGSLLHDDLQLEDEEHIVPLFIEGRQLDTYRLYVKQHQEVLEQFLGDRQNFEPLSKVKEILAHLRAIETHIDLVFAEAESSSIIEDAATQIEHSARFGRENSVKFKFLHSLFHSLRDHKKHVLLVTEKNDDALFRILEIFCKAEYVDYNIPTKGRQADPAAAEGLMSVTIIPSTESPIIRAPDVIICLDGVQKASQIRQQNWAQSSFREVVPVIHLVISRTVDSIERFIAQSLSWRDQLHATVAILAQMYLNGTLGKPVDENAPRASALGPMVVDWLVESHGDSSWLLPALDSIKNVMEYQSQVSPELPALSTPPKRYKRPLDGLDIDPSKRMRLTPQPHAPSSSVTYENEITRVTDSMPGTAEVGTSGVDDPDLLRILARTKEALHQEQAARKADQQKLEMWERQLMEHEDLRREHRALINQNKATEAKLETVTKSLEVTRERLQSRTTELHEKTRELEVQRATDLLSADIKTQEITKLRQELAIARDENTRALKDAASANNMLDYIKEARRVAEDALVSTRNTITVLTAENKNLAHQASGQSAKLKALHFDRHTENLAKQNKLLKNEKTVLKKSLTQKEEDLVRMRTGRVGVGTRGTSMTPQPKTRSRAGSPIGGGRVSHLRKE